MYALRVAVKLSLALLFTLALALPGEAQQGLLLQPGPTTRGLLAWWLVRPSQSGGRQVFNVALPYYHATLIGATTAGTTGWVSTTRPGGTGEIRLNGTTTYLTVPTTGILQPNYFTFMAWVRLTSLPPSDYVTILSSATSHGLHVRSDGKLAAYITTSGGTPTIDPGDTALTLGPWYHIALTYGPAVLATWINCQLDVTAGNAGTLVVSGQPTILAADGGGTSRWLAGALGEVRIYDRALTGPELCTAMRESRQGDPARWARTRALEGILPPGATGSSLLFFQPQ